jgi:hypothetical protein
MTGGMLQAAPSVMFWDVSSGTAHGGMVLIAEITALAHALPPNTRGS